MKPTQWPLRLPSYTLLFLCLLQLACGRSGFDHAQCILPRPGNWTTLDTSTDGTGLNQRITVARNLSCAVGADGTVYLAWSDDSSGIRQVYLRTWDGISWSGLANSDNEPISSHVGVARTGGMISGDTGQILVSWMQEGTARGRSIYLKSWDGTSWTELAASASAGGVSDGGGAWWPSITVDEHGTPWLAYEAHIPTGIYVRHLETTERESWVGIDGSAETGGIATDGGYFARIAWLNQAVHVVWVQNEQIYHRWIEPYAEATWSPSVTLGSGTSPALLRTGDSLLLAWESNEQSAVPIVVARFSDGIWTRLPHPLVINAAAKLEAARSPRIVMWHTQPTLAISARGDGNRDIYLSRFDGTSWHAFENISHSTTDSLWPTLTSHGRRIFVFWEEELAAGSAQTFGMFNQLE